MVLATRGQRRSTATRVAEQLRNRLPEYMVPRYLDVVDDLPLMTSGKVDRKLLPPPMTMLGRTDRNIVAADDRDSSGRSPRPGSRCIQASPISIDDDFFLDLRGHSLFAAQDGDRVAPALSWRRRLSVPDFYEYRTARRLAEFLDKSAAARPVGAAEAIAAGARPAAEAQSEMVDAARPPLPRFRWLCVPLQALALIVYYGVISAPVAVCGRRADSQGARRPDAAR